MKRNEKLSREERNNMQSFAKTTDIYLQITSSI